MSRRFSADPDLMLIGDALQFPQSPTSLPAWFAGLPEPDRLMLRAVHESTIARLQPSSWTRGVYARSADGDSVSAVIGMDDSRVGPNPAAVQCCAAGHLYQAAAFHAQFDHAAYHHITGLCGQFQRLYLQRYPRSVWFTAADDTDVLVPVTNISVENDRAGLTATIELLAEMLAWIELALLQ